MAPTAAATPTSLAYPGETVADGRTVCNTASDILCSETMPAINSKCRQAGGRYALQWHVARERGDNT